jgi:hypothetical protein
MPADLVPESDIPHLAEQVSPAMRKVLQRLRDHRYIHNVPDLLSTTAAVLKRLSALGLVDPGYARPDDGSPFIWVSNDNGARVLRHLEQTPEKPDLELSLHPRAAKALASLPDEQVV